LPGRRQSECGVTPGLGPEYSLTAGSEPAPGGHGVLVVLLLAKQIGLGDYPSQLAVAVQHRNCADLAFGEQPSNLLEGCTDLYGRHPASHYVVNLDVPHRFLLLAVPLFTVWSRSRCAQRLLANGGGTFASLPAVLGPPA
jgi:hypothetical protein